MVAASCYAGLTSAYAAEAELDCVKKIDQCTLRRRCDVDPLERATAKIIHTDEDVFNKFIWLVRYGLPYTLHVFQRRFFDIIVQVLAEYLLGDSWTRVSSYYRQQYGWKHMNRVAFAMAARRFGKTVVASQTQAALAMVKQTRIVTLSTGQRASDGMRNAVLHCITNSPFADLMCRAKKEEEIFVRTIFDRTMLTSMRFLPASPQVLQACTRCRRRCCAPHIGISKSRTGGFFSWRTMPQRRG